MNEERLALLREVYIRRHGPYPVIVSFEDDEQSTARAARAAREMRTLEALGIEAKHIVVSFVSPMASNVKEEESNHGGLSHGIRF